MQDLIKDSQTFITPKKLESADDLVDKSAKTYLKENKIIEVRKIIEYFLEKKENCKNILSSTESTTEKTEKKKDSQEQKFSNIDMSLHDSKDNSFIAINPLSLTKKDEEILFEVDKEKNVKKKPNKYINEISLKKNNIIKNDEGKNKTFIININININAIFEKINSPDVEIHHRVEKKNSKKGKNKEKPIYYIPIDKIKEELKNKENKENNKLKSKITIENLKKNLNSNINKNINNYPLTNSNNYNNGFHNYSNVNNPYIYNNKINNCLNMNVKMYNIIQFNYYKKILDKIIKQKKEFQILYNLGLSSLKKPNNNNHYIWYTNSFNNNIYQFNNNLLYNNNFGFLNPILPNYHQNNNIVKISNINNIINCNNKNNQNQEQYIITYKSKTNNPNIDRVSKIKVTTSYVKENLNEKKDIGLQKHDKKKLINLEYIESNKETRTVVRLNPIPPNYSSFYISKLLDKYLNIESGKNQRIYKALYVPLCKTIGKNLGYCFVMMVKPKYVIDFYKTFEGKSFGKKKCKKPCNVIWADIQGEPFLKIDEEDPLRKPIIFRDLRDD